jgi:hypothetical protein
MIAVLIATLLLGPAGLDTVPAAAQPPADAYLDEGARELVARARARGENTAREILEYRAVARERLSFGLRTLGRERLFFRRELAARIHWRRDAQSSIEVLGARFVTPSMSSRVGVPKGSLGGDIASLAFDPAGNNLFDALLGAGDGSGIQISGDGWMRHPLAEGSEAHYRFRSGRSTDLRLGDGTVIRLHELEVLPRRRDSQLLRGTIWLDAETYAPVRVTMRLARAFDLDLDSPRMGPDEDDASDVPRILKPIRVDLRLLTVEYSLWRDESGGSAARWWLPRLLAVDGIGEVNMMPDFPVRFERAYDEMRVFGTPADAAVADASLTPAVFDRCPRRPRAARGGARADTASADSTGDSGRARGQINIGIGSRGATADVVLDDAAADSAGIVCSCTDGRCRNYAVHVPADTLSLASSAYLAASPFEAGELLVTGEQVSALAEQLRGLAPAPWGFQPPLVRWSYVWGDLARYNRVEGLSLGTRVEADFGAYAATATGRLGGADLDPNLELSAARRGREHTLEATGYRRLVPVDEGARPFGLANSLGALVFGVDDGDYFRGWGADLRGAPSTGRPQWYAWRLFGERQVSAAKGTDWSVPHLFRGGHVFRETIVADSATQYGGALSLRTWRGLNPAGLRGGAELNVEAATGDYGYVRPALTLSAGLPLPGRYVGALEVGAGTAFGDVPAQRLHYLGGGNTVRGYPGAAAVGTSFWRARAEIGNSLPAARLVLFSDAGWAGPRDDVRLDPALLSAGVGASFLDGLVRLDLARALRGATGWRFTVHADVGL